MSSLSRGSRWGVALAFGALGCTNDFATFSVNPRDAGADHAGGAGASGGAATTGMGGAGAAISSAAGGAGGSAGGSGGSAGAGKCGPNGTNTITDDFEGPDLSAVWGVPYKSAATFSQTGGKAVIHLAQQESGMNYAGIYSVKDDYDLRECEVIVQVVELPDIGAPAEFYFVVGLGTNTDYAVMAEHEGTLTFRVISAPALDGSTPYDPAEHKWWRIRHAVDTIHFETSKDAKSWTHQYEEPAPAWVDTVKIDLGSGTYGSSSSPGQTRFDNLNRPP